MPKLSNTAATVSSALALKQHAENDALFMSIGDGAITTDEFGRITRVNPVAELILGFTKNELIGQWFPDKIVAVDEDLEPINLIDRSITKVFSTGETVLEKVYYLNGAGEAIPMAVSVSPIMVDGVAVGAIEVFRSVAIENAIDRMKSEFISLASHQLRTPLSAIKTYAHMLVDGYMGDLQEEQRRSIKTIIGATNRMNELISTLLNITRLEAGSISVKPRSLYVSKSIQRVIKELALLAGDRNIKLVFKQSDKLVGKVYTDSLILEEILANLIGNAIKYTQPGGKVAVNVKSEKDSVLASIKDNGWGIPLSAQEQIFSKFFRAQNIIQRETTGTGLGLYLARGLVDRLGGRIWFESIEGKGTTFWVCLPKRAKAKAL